MVATPGTDASLERVKAAWKPRFLANGVQPYDYETTVARVSTWDAWPEAWAATAAEHSQAADRAQAAGHALTAAELRHAAALALHFAYFASPRPLEAWLAAQRRKADLFRRSAAALDPPAESVSIPFEGVQLPAFLRLPRGASRPPVVLFISGLDSTKEEHTTFEDVLLRRGLATLTFDGPGQGEVWERMPARVDWERAASAAVDFVETRADLARTRVGALGVSMGGYLAPRCAALEPRIRAAAAIGGRFDQADRDYDDPLHTPRLLHFWNAPDTAALRRALEAATLEGVIQRMDRPLLVVHGDRDTLAPTASARLIYERTAGPKTWVLYPEGNHVCNNIPHKYRPLVADWLAEQLAA